MNYIEPSPLATKYTCPHCGTLAEQMWWYRDWRGGITNRKIKVGKCKSCENHTLWIDSVMFYPESGNAPFPNPEMPKPVKRLYDEAAAIKAKSPRGAAALLRLAIQVLCKELGESGKNINSDIKELVKKGLPEIVQKSLDIVRVTGNDAVHPGQIDTDDPEVVKQLFELINIIVEYMIAMPNKVSGIYKALPAEKLKGISDRDNR